MSERIASFKDGSQVSGDFSDDAVAADREIVIRYNCGSRGIAGAPAVFSNAAIEGAAGGLSLLSGQYLRMAVHFTNINPGASTGFSGVYLYQGTGFSGQELRITATDAPMANYQYRVTLSTTEDSGDVVSEVATLTFS